MIYDLRDEKGLWKRGVTMDKKFGLPMATVVGLVLLAGAPTKSSTHDFYKDKTIRFVVGFGLAVGMTLLAGL